MRHIESVAFGKVYPQYGNELYTTNFTCGRDAFKFAAKTETATVIAGEEIGLGWRRLRLTYDASSIPLSG